MVQGNTLEGELGLWCQVSGYLQEREEGKALPQVIYKNYLEVWQDGSADKDHA